MPWQIIVLLRVFCAHVVVSTMLKKLTARPSRTRQIALQFGVCTFFSLIWVIVVGQKLIVSTTFFIALLGIVNSFACYTQWRAVDISLSKTAFFTQFDDIIAISLGFVFLGEKNLLSPTLVSGMVLCIGAAVSFSLFGKKSDKEQGKNRIRELFFAIFTYSVIWGVATFAMRYFALNNISLPHFLMSWYGGSFVGSLLLLRFAGEKERGAGLTVVAVRNVLVFSVFIWLSMVLGYWAFIKAPIAVVQPIFQVTEMVFPAIIGLWLFKEAKTLSKVEKIVFATGLSGVTIIMIVF